ncbi:MAG: hypothetical protein HOB40_01880 [Candidatus Marinimicrobia bacterium]|nr:hypothetical protein [Candidatus Neomarinimicrobiota bacterium]MBT3839576.1 hypothetical protein [Candidatus Neomarinimicrobiota bacterium]MBT3999713.1 hypothetical protein [Candidatus Neomarinimicrobiota bacterium]MBT4282102.1 hypothetical protein [Candidatus Neomarinimicrobiota bacterium]MBT4578841.1 hypothetical protein [Candidatus Neomarinimicrobiota bacterium]
MNNRLQYIHVFLCLTIFSTYSSAKSIRIYNISDRDFKNVSIMKQSYGDIHAGETSDYKKVKTVLSYAAMKMTIDEKYVTGQTLNIGSKSFTYEINIIDLEKGWLVIEVVRD